MMLRAAAFALIAANVVFFAWARGWLAPVLPPPHHGEREPERLAAQVRPELVRFVAAPAASAASAGARCLEAGPFTDAEIGGAETALRSAGVPAAAWSRDEVQQQPAWLVYMGRFASAEALRTKEEELRRLRLTTFEELKAPPDLAPGLALSRHDSQAAADTALAQFAQRGVRTARVVALPPPPLQHWLRAPQADAATQEKLGALGSPAFAPCQPRR
jgi:hypothetical protein